MYGGGSGKLGRGGGGGGGSRGGGRHNRSSFPPPPPSHRPSAPAGRHSLGGGGAAPRTRTSSSSAPSRAPPAPPPVEETFSLVAGNPLAFAAIIRLAPDLVDEIKRVEAQGGAAKIKFDSIANNTALSVIEVGGKDFRFTWSHELPDLCDIYEERQSGEDGNGLLVESGCAQRKVNVQRILDESTKNHVKMRSEEAERKLKSRKAIILDPENPSTKNQIMAIAAVDANPWKSGFKPKKEPPHKKRKTDPPLAPPKSVHKAGPSVAAIAKGRSTGSPLPVPASPDQSGAVASPSRAGNLTKGYPVTEVISPQDLSKENTVSLEKDIPGKAATGVVPGKMGRKGKVGAKPADLQSMLVTLLIANPKGMSVKALEKAIGDTIPNSVRKIEPIIKKIATFQAPGRYFLKPGVELEGFKKPSFRHGSSPEDNHEQTPPIEDSHQQTPPINDHHDQGPASEPNFAEKASTRELEEQELQNSKLGDEPNSMENIDIQQHSPDLFGEKKMSDNSEGHVGSSSDSGSDSDSESDSSDSGSDSGSHSRSRSKSRSPVGSSSDSESDASNSKQGSDEDVDIMTSDDDKEPKPNLLTAEVEPSSLSIPWRTPDGSHVQQNGIDEKHDGHISDVGEIEKILLDEQDAEMAVLADLNPNNEGEIPGETNKPFSPYPDEHREHQARARNSFDERGGTNRARSRHDKSDGMERPHKGKHRKGSEMKQPDEKSDRAKKSKSGSLAQTPVYGGREAQFLDVPNDLSPDRLHKSSYKGVTDQMMSRTDGDGDVGSGMQKKYYNENPGKFSLDSRQTGRKAVDLGARAKAAETAERPSKHAEDIEHGALFHAADGFPTQKDKVCRGTQDEDGYTNDIRAPRNFREGVVGDTYPMPSEPTYRKKELIGKYKDARQVAGSPKDKNRIEASRSPPVNDRGKNLQRELSDLELGELREPLPEETTLVRKQFERGGSFKQLENRPSTSDNWDIDFGKGRPVGKTSQDLRKMSPPNLGDGTPTNLDSVPRKSNPEYQAEDITRPQPRVVQSQPQYPSRAGLAEVGPQFNRLTDEGGNAIQSEAAMSQEISIEESRETHRRASAIGLQQHDNKREMASHSLKENKTKKSNILADASDRRNESLAMEMNNDGRKRKESSSGESSCPYSKYEKEDPELKEPIKDFSQYKEYVQEYREKYDSYCSLNKILEDYRNVFHKLGRDLDVAKARDMERYHNILDQLNESYRQCGARHKRLKKIFIVLHEELKHLKQRIKDFAVAYTKD